MNTATKIIVLILALPALTLFAPLTNSIPAARTLDESLYKQSFERIRTLGLSRSAHIVHGDRLQQHYSSADLLTIYLLPVAIERVTPIFEKQLKKGARVAAHDFEFPQWTQARILGIDGGGAGRSHRLYLDRR